MSEFEWRPLLAYDRDTRTFISYRSTGVELAEAVERALADAGNQVWRDKRTLPVGDEWRTEIVRGIEWCQRLVLLLTPGAEDSDVVLEEVELALGRKRRVEAYCVGRVERMRKPSASETARRLYDRLAHLHIAQISEGPDEAARVCAAILSDEQAGHPMDGPVFRRVFSRRALGADELGALSGADLRTYLNNRRTPQDDGACLTANYCLMLACLGKVREACSLAEEAIVLEHPVLDLYYSALLCDGKRPGVLAPTCRTRAIAAARRAFAATRAPLPGLHLCLMLWDAGMKRGPGAARMIASAIDAVAQSATDREELQRYQLIFPLDKLQGPVSGAELKTVLNNIGR